MSEHNPYGFDPATDTLRVSRHDLHRLLPQFRIVLERDEDDEAQWSHMVDYDKSFECLADAVDYARSVAPYGRDRSPDYRMRCKRTSVYRWPDHAPYDGRSAEAAQISDKASRRDYGTT